MIDKPVSAVPGTETLQPGYMSEHSLNRLTRYLTYRAFYEGAQWDDAPGAGEIRVTLNYCRVFINKAASYLLSKPVGYDATLPAEARGSRVAKSEGAKAVERYLEEVSAFSDLPGLDLDTCIQAGILGDGAYTVRWDAQAGMPRVTAVDPQGLDCRWRQDDLRTLTWVRQSYWVSPVELTQEQQARLYEAEGAGADPYQAQRAEEEWTQREWRLKVGGQAVDGGPNPYGEIPYIVFPNLRVPGEFWGEGDLADLVGLQQELNRRVSIFAQLLNVCGNPVVVVEGATEEETASLRLGPNQLWTLPRDAKADVLELMKSGGADAHLKFIDSLYRGLHDISEMPRTSFGDSSGQSQARSGVALEIELQPLLHKIARKRAILSSAYTRRAALILKIARLHGVELPEARVRPIWPAVLPQDRAALVQQEVALVGARIHPPTKAIALLEEPDPDEVLARVIEEGKKLAGLGEATLTPRPPLPRGEGENKKEKGKPGDTPGTPGGGKPPAPPVAKG